MHYFIRNISKYRRKKLIRWPLVVSDEQKKFGETDGQPFADETTVPDVRRKTDARHDVAVVHEAADVERDSVLGGSETDPGSYFALQGSNRPGKDLIRSILSVTQLAIRIR